MHFLLWCQCESFITHNAGKYSMVFFVSASSSYSPHEISQLTWIIKLKTNQSPIASFNTFHWISYSMTNMAVKSWMRLMMCRPTYFDVIHKVGHVNWYLVNFIIYYWFPFSIKADKITNHNAHGSKQTVLLYAFGSWSWYAWLLKAYCSPKSIPNS